MTGLKIEGSTETTCQPLDHLPQRPRQIHKIIHQNKEITEDKCIANAFNEYFCTVGQNLAQKFRNSQANYLNYLAPRNKESMFLHPVTETEVLKAIDSHSLQTNKAIGEFDIPIKLIKMCKLHLPP